MIDESREFGVRDLGIHCRLPPGLELGIHGKLSSPSLASLEELAALFLQATARVAALDQDAAVNTCATTNTIVVTNRLDGPCFRRKE
jgi:hypothetical protein